MEYRLVKELLKDICNAIRLKDDTTDLIPHRDIAKHILDIPTRVVYHDDLTSDNVNLNPTGIHDIMDGVCDALRFRTRTKEMIAHADIPRFINENVLVHFNPGVVENVGLDDIGISVNNMKIFYKDQEYIENVSISSINVSAEMLYAKSAIAVSAANQPSGEPEPNWGKIVCITFNEKVVSGGSNTEFEMSDTSLKIFRPASMSIGTDLHSIILEFVDFNTANGECTVKYTGNSMKCEVAVLEKFEIKFIPTNLILPDTDPPIPTKAYNTELGGNV